MQVAVAIPDPSGLLHHRHDVLLIQVNLEVVDLGDCIEMPPVRVVQLSLF